MLLFAELQFWDTSYTMMTLVLLIYTKYYNATTKSISFVYLILLSLIFQTV
jgi:hypothetical protein